MTLHFRRAPIWIVLNLIGMAMYLWLGSDRWTVPGDEGLPGGPGDAFYWFFLMLPVLLAESRGALRVTLPLGVAMTFVYPYLHEFSLQFPKIDLDLQVSDRIVDLVGNGFDIALRAGHPKDSDLMSRRFATF